MYGLQKDETKFKVHHYKIFKIYSTIYKGT